MAQDNQNLLEMIDRPAFTVENGVITHCNQMAKNRQISAGTAISELFPEGCTAYEGYHGGILYLTLQLGWIQCGATVVRQEDGDILDLAGLPELFFRPKAFRLQKEVLP